MTTPVAATPVAEAKGLTKRFGDLLAVDDVGFSIAPGETYGLLGPNGAGKTTTISMICGLLSPDAGEVRVMDEVIKAGSPHGKGAIGLVPQDLALYPELTADENLRFFGSLQTVEDLPGRTDVVLDVIGLTDRRGDKVGDYSGGMKRRLNIGVALLHEPELLILDEPTVGVDPQSRNAILESVEALSSEGTAVLYTTHYMEEAERLCDRVGIIDGGRLIAEGTRRELVTVIGEKDRIIFEIEGDGETFAKYLRSLDGVHEASGHEGHVEALVSDAAASLSPLIGRAGDQGLVVRGVRVEEPDLEAVFLHMTGRGLRDE
ncbi:MAG: ATP-binding cassette domain-containing protein [Acidimicrobiia bacterium]|nr:ATP-binding cassette domain-containing protein [Acidimicrobiia bacterium]